VGAAQAERARVFHGEQVAGAAAASAGPVLERQDDDQVGRLALALGEAYWLRARSPGAPAPPPGAPPRPPGPGTRAPGPGPRSPGTGSPRRAPARGPRRCPATGLRGR